MKESIIQAIDKVIKELMDVKQGIPIQAQKIETPKKSDFETLKQVLFSDKWPEAVAANLICDPNSEKDKIERGRGIIEIMLDKVQDIRFLDFGCGEGHAALFVAEEGNTSVGYDIVANWSVSHTNLFLTTSFAEVQAKAPYDVILLFDVIDHLVGETPVMILKKAASVLTDGGKIFMRTHPFTSRHACHQYRQVNKAFLHLVFTDEEMKEIASVSEPNIGVTRPIMTYEKYISEAGLKEVTRKEIKEDPEAFFKIPKIAQRIMKKTKFDSLPLFQMAISFIDYFLQKG